MTLCLAADHCLPAAHTYLPGSRVSCCLPSSCVSLSSFRPFLLLALTVVGVWSLAPCKQNRASHFVLRGALAYPPRGVGIPREAFESESSRPCDGMFKPQPSRRPLKRAAAPTRHHPIRRASLPLILSHCRPVCAECSF